MTSNAVAVLSDVNQAELMARIGQNEAGTPIIPQLKINREFENDDGDSLMPGSYVVSIPGVGTVYSKTARFRPFLNMYQYSHFDQDQNKYLNKTILAPKLTGVELIDELGGKKCGRVDKKLQDQLTPEEMVKQKAIKCYRNLYGVLTMPDAVNAKRDATPIENVPVLWRTTGVQFLPIQSAIDSISKQRKLMFNYEFTLSTTKDKKGSNTYYIANLAVDMTKHIPFTEEDLEILSNFEALVANENDGVIQKWKRVHDSKKNIVDSAATIDAVSYDLNDDIPEHLRG